MHTDDTQLELSSKTNTSLWEYVVDACEWSEACDDRKVDDNRAISCRTFVLFIVRADKPSGTYVLYICCVH